MKKFKTSPPCKPEQSVSDANRSHCHCLPFMSQNVIRKCHNTALNTSQLQKSRRALGICQSAHGQLSMGMDPRRGHGYSQAEQTGTLANSRDGRTGGVQWRLGMELCPGKPCLAWHWTGLNPAGPASSPEPWLCCWLCPRQAPGTLLGDALPVVHSPSSVWFPCKAL